MPDLRISLIQTSIFWERPAENLARYGRLMDDLAATDLMVLPEMFPTGFTMNPAPHAETMDGPTLAWMAERARVADAAIVGSVIIKEDDRYYNRLVFQHPDGRREFYDKRHLFTMAGEHERYTAGTKRLIVDYRGWRICPLVCYDLRFPVWSRNDADYDLLLYVANWPDRRSEDWRALLRARAIENQCYVAAVNRVGEDENGHHYRGDSCVIDPGWRRTLFAAGKVEATQTITLDRDHLQKVRRQLPFLDDRDDFELTC